MNDAYGFRSVIAVHVAGQPWRDLVEYATMLACNTGRLDAVIAAPDDQALEAGLRAAREHRADLLVMRHPRVSGQSRRSAQRILRTAPCSVCFVPDEAPARAGRILAGIDLNGAGRALLARATQLCRGVSAEELIAVHCCSQTTADDEAVREHFRFKQTLGLFRFMSHAELNGVACTPILEEGATAHKALARVVVERSADLVVMGREPGGRASIMSEFLWNCASPAVQVLLPEPGGLNWACRLARSVRRVFSNPEPTFN